MTDAYSLQQLNWVDYTVIAIIVVSSLISLVRGFVREALSIVTWVVAFWIAFTFSAKGAALLAPYIKNTSLQVAVAFAILFVVTLIVGGMLNFLITQLVHRTGLSGTDRTLGLVFGVTRGVLLVAVLILLAGLTTIPKDDWWKSSQLVPHFQPLANWMRGFLPDKTKKGDVSKQGDLIKQGHDLLRKQKESQQPEQQ